MLVLPPVVDLALAGDGGPFRYLAADAFYYLTVARNLLDHHRFSFDGVTATNGFHPLWQVVLAGLLAAGRAVGLAEHRQLGAVVLANLAALAVAVVGLAAALRRAGRLTPLFVLLPVGAVGFLLAPIWIALGPARVTWESGAEGGRPLYATLWSFANGMESSLVILLFAALALGWRRGARRGGIAAAIGYGLLLGAFALARLDHAVLPLLLLAWLVARERRGPGAARRIAALAAGPILLLGGYLAINRLAFGAYLPVSGGMKSSFPDPFVANLDPALRLLAGEWPGLPLTVRLLQAIVPLVGAATYLLSVLARPAPRRWADAFWTVSAAAVLAIAVYDLVFVDLWHQGHWYFPLSTVWLSCVLVRAAGRRRWARPRSPRWEVVGHLAPALLALGIFVFLFRDPAYHRRFVEFYFDEAPRLVDRYAGERVGFVELDDGIFAFATGLPTLAGLGFALDAEAAAAHARGRLLDLALSRGFDRLVSIQHLKPTGPLPARGEPVDDQPEIRSWIAKFLGSAALGRYHFELDERSPDGRFVVVRVVPRAAGVAFRPTEQAAR